MIDPSKRYRDAGASDELATVLAQAEQELIERIAGICERPSDPTPEFFKLLRANGVTRYRHGDLEIELSPTVAADMPGQWLPGMSPLERDRSRYQKAAHFLWELLDRIAKTDDVGLAERRLEEAIVVDGRLTWKWEEDGHLTRKPTGIEAAAKEAGYLDGHSRTTGKVEQDLHKSEPPDEQPAVEIDFAATEELLRAQDARRRGTG